MALTWRWHGGTRWLAAQEMAFQDGSPPPQHILDSWLSLCDKVFKKKSDGESKTAPTVAVHCVAGLGRCVDHASSHATPLTHSTYTHHTHMLAHALPRGIGEPCAPRLQMPPVSPRPVRCCASVGRAPVLVAVALIEAGLQPLEAVDFVRKHRCVRCAAYARTPATCTWH